MEKFKILSNKMRGRNGNSAVKNSLCLQSALTFIPLLKACFIFEGSLSNSYLTLNSFPFTLVACAFGEVWPSRNRAHSALT